MKTSGTTWLQSCSYFNSFKSVRSVNYAAYGACCAKCVDTNLNFAVPVKGSSSSFITNCWGWTVLLLLLLLFVPLILKTFRCSRLIRALPMTEDNLSNALKRLTRANETNLRAFVNSITQHRNKYFDPAPAPPTPYLAPRQPSLSNLVHCSDHIYSYSFIFLFNYKAWEITNKQSLFTMQFGL